jgi:hypothetical protein
MQQHFWYALRPSWGSSPIEVKEATSALMLDRARLSSVEEAILRLADVQSRREGLDCGGRLVVIHR